MSLIGSNSNKPFLRFFRSGQDRYAMGAGSLIYGSTLSTTLASGANGVTCGFASMGNVAWFMNISLRRFMAGSTHYQWGIDSPIVSGAAAAASGAGPLSGTFTYYLTYANDFGHESNGSSAIGSVTASSEGVQLSSLPTSADTQVTIIHIYRIGGGVLSPQRIATIANGTSSYLDTISVTDQQTTATAMPTDHDLPPPAYGLVGPFFGRLVAFRSLDYDPLGGSTGAAYPGRFWWSKTAQPWAWPGAADPDDGNWQDCGDVREAIFAAAVHNRQLRFYKEKSIWRLDGDPDSNDPEQTNASAGIVGPHAVASAGAMDYYRGPEGVYRFNGDREEKISTKIDPIFKGEYTKVGAVSVPPANDAYAETTCMALRFGRLYMSYCSNDAPTPGVNDVTLVCDLAEGRWYHHRLKTGSFSHTGFTALYDEGTGGTLIGGVRGPVSAIAYNLEDGTDDASAYIPLIWQSRFSDQGKPDNEKVYQDLVVDYSTADTGEARTASLTIKAIYDNVTEAAVGTLSANGRSRKTFTLGSYPGKMARNLSVYVEGDTDSTVRINEVSVNYYLEPRRARHWDSGWLDFGSRSLKQILAVELDIESDGTVTLDVHNDVVSMSFAFSTTFAAATTRKLVHLQQEASPFTLISSASKSADARNFRFLLSVADGKYFKLYGMRVKLQPIETYLLGTNGETWQSEALNLGN